MGFLTLYKRDMMNIITNPPLVLTNTIFPLLFIVILGYLSSDIYGEGAITSYDYYGITILIYSVLNVSMTASNSFMESSLKSSNLRVMYSPIRTSYVYITKVLATFTFTSICLLFVMLVTHIWLKVSFGGRYAIYVVIIALLFNMLSSVVGILCCCILKSEEVTNAILTIINNIFAILGGIFFSLDGYGDMIRVVSYISPVKWVVECMMKIVYDHDLSLFGVTGSIFIVLSSLGLFFCSVFFKEEDYV
ncbi:ABC transporter permease [Bacillus pseudomycoides]|uniref:Transport permease protein n=1 Tax=Bacillus pseudomycoides TaxID=64104 RepID=A0AA91VEA0_9BACI|nr:MULTISPECIES: ABC transporter permease [Bacillus]PEB52642.1 ABC transporter permease [Bacillus sp. AFS098217]PED83103.1 ABC transporter permease [Bacillus pseudomycoides]PEU13956.1 ABC transporter permease [Bacillus sp. AFS019443]PEU18824.1 ABC transporter permease [Bacillus sp. AFS014408]PFW63714.1 ABC transporter permease [Bacillus sp. AFS075034]